MNLLKMNIFKKFFTPCSTNYNLLEIKESIQNKGGVNTRPTGPPPEEPPTGQGGNND